MPAVKHAPFLLLSIRAEPDAAADEYRAVMRFAGLDETSLHCVNLTGQRLPTIDFAEWSGIILGGGPYNVSDSLQEKSAAQQRTEAELLPLIGEIARRDFPFLGCCYGIGTLGTVIGATIDRKYSEPVGTVRVTLNAAGAADPLCAGLPREFDAYAGHKEAVSWLPEQAVALASSVDCPVQAFRVGHNVYATQFHPELDADGLCTRIDVYKNHGYFAPETAADLKRAARQGNVTHPPVMLARFARRYARPHGLAPAAAGASFG